MILLREADRRAAHFLRACVGRHDEYGVAEIRLATVVVRQGPVIHHLQQQVEDLRVRLLDLVEQHDCVRILGDGLCQQPTLIEPDITRWRTNQARYRMTLHVLRHVEANQLDTENHRELPGDFCLADAGRARKQEHADGLVFLAQAGT